MTTATKVLIGANIILGVTILLLLLLSPSPKPGGATKCVDITDEVKAKGALPLSCEPDEVIRWRRGRPDKFCCFPQEKP